MMASGQPISRRAASKTSTISTVPTATSSGVRKPLRWSSGAYSTQL